MPLKAIAGVSGSFAYTGHNARIMQWEVTTAQDINDASGFGGSGNWRENLYGMKGWRFRASGYCVFDDANGNPDADFSATNDSTATGITFTGTVTTGCTYVGVAYPSSFVIAQGINGNATFQMEGVGTGALTETWDVTP